MRVDVAAVRRRRREQRERRLRAARGVADDLASRLELVAAVVVGSVARGDHGDTSDVDLLVVVEGLPADFRARATLVEPDRSGVDVIAWTVAEWDRAVRARNPLAVEAQAVGHVLRGALPTEDPVS